MGEGRLHLFYETTHSPSLLPVCTRTVNGFWCRQDCRSDKIRSAPRRCGLCCHDVTPDHRGIRPPWDRNCELAFVNLLRQFDADNHAPRIVERLEPQHRSQSPLHPAVVLLHNIVQILTATNRHRVPPPEVELPVHSHASQGAMARLVAIQSDAVWLPMMLQRLAKEGLRRRDATCSTQIELHGVALSVHGSIQVHQLAPHLDKRFINPPTPTHRPLESAPTLLASFSIADMTQRKIVVCEIDKPRSPKIADQVSVTQFEAKIPAQAEENDVVIEPTSGK